MKLPFRIPFVNTVGFLDKLLFTKHLSIMLKSGIPLSEATATLLDQTTNQTFRKILKSIEKDITDGQPLANSLEKFPDVFDSFYINLVKIGEESGKLEENLQYLALQLSKNYEFKKKVRGAMMYPMIVLFTAALVGSGIAIFVLPKLITLFESLDVKLPLTTIMLLFLATTMKNFGVFIIPGGFGLIALAAIVVNLPGVRQHWHKFLLTIPKMGSFITDAQVATFCRNFGIMLKSGLPITNALEAEYDATDNYVFKMYIGRMLKAVEKGDSLEQELTRGHYKHFPPLVAKMIGVGEKTGSLEEVLLYLGDFYGGEVDDMAKNLPSVIEPIMLFGIAIIVAFVALAIISPIYNLVGSLHR